MKFVDAWKDINVDVGNIGVVSPLDLGTKVEDLELPDYKFGVLPPRVSNVQIFYPDAYDKITNPQ